MTRVWIWQHGPFDLGDKWQCDCGKIHSLSGGYLAAHWELPLTFVCDKCSAKYRVQDGHIEQISPSRNDF